jgi:hypothetical protein
MNMLALTYVLPFAESALVVPASPAELAVVFDSKTVDLSKYQLGEVQVVRNAESDNPVIVSLSRHFITRYLRDIPLEGVEEPAKTLTCVYCGHEYPPGTPASQHELLDEHIRQCPKHPLTAANAQIEEMQSFVGDVQAGCDIVRGDKLYRQVEVIKGPGLTRDQVELVFANEELNNLPGHFHNRKMNTRVICSSPQDKCCWNGLVDEGEPLDEHMRTVTLEADNGQKPRCRCPQCGNICYSDMERRYRRRILVVIDQYGGSTQTIYSDADADDMDIEVVMLDSDNDTKNFMTDSNPPIVGATVHGYAETETFHDSFIVEHYSGCTVLSENDRRAIMSTSAVRGAIAKGFRNPPAPADSPFKVEGRPRYVYADSWEHLDEDNKPYHIRWVYDRHAHDLTDTSELIDDSGVKTQRTQEIIHGSDWWKDVWDHLVNANPEVLNGTGDPEDFGVKEVDANGLPEWAVEACTGAANAQAGT